MLLVFAGEQNELYLDELERYAAKKSKDKKWKNEKKVCMFSCFLIIIIIICFLFLNSFVVEEDERSRPQNGAGSRGFACEACKKEICKDW